MPTTPSRLSPILRDVAALSGLGALHLTVQALLTGAVAGFVIGAFRMAYTWLNGVSSAHVVVHLAPFSPQMPPWYAFAALFACLTALGLLGWWLLRRVPLISGSGIPQVELVLAGRLPAFSWWRVLAAKFVGTLVSLTGWLSVGREGPCIQMGACVGAGVGRLWHRDGEMSARSLIGGCVAGMTAAFGAPMAGMAFAFEEMRTPLSPPLVLFCALAALAAELVVSEVLQLGLVFPFGELAPGGLDAALALLWLVPLCGLCMGVFGAGYNALLMGLTHLGDRIFPKTTRAQALRVLLAFWLAGVLVCLYPTVIVGLGPGVVEQAGLALSWPLLALLLLLACKVLFSCLSFASTVAGGLLMPMLGVGALCGTCLHGGLYSGLETLLPQLSRFFALPAPGLTLTLCMAALFAATVRAPLTGAVLLLEMTGAWREPWLIPLVIATAYVAAFTANACKSEPVYDSLKRRILKNIANTSE